MISLFNVPELYMERLVEKQTNADISVRQEVTGMEQLICKSCGAPLRADGKCEYCGAIYRFANNTMQTVAIEICHPEVVPLTATACIHRDLLYADDVRRISEHAIESVKRKLVDGLTDYIKLETHSDPYQNAIIIRGSVRVVEPDFRF